MANVYATLADGGYRNSPIAITKVVFPDGYTDTNWGKPNRVKVISNGVTSEETSILEQNVESGTATRSAIDCPTAAKTGTTSNLVDAWLDGYTPDYSTSVWMGYPNKLVPMTDVHGEPQQGGYLPAEIWHAYMAAVTEGKSCASFPPPSEPISYQPFFGKFATTGRALVKESYEGEESTKQNLGRQHTHGKGAQGEHVVTPEPSAGNHGEEHATGPPESDGKPVAAAPAPRIPEPAEPVVPKEPATPVGGTGGEEPPTH
jgi:membrane peptidoglycan carboxypeptidase